jgi:hypothetical protein
VLLASEAGVHKGLTLELMQEELALSRLEPDAPLPPWAISASFHAVVRTPGELSIVCPSARVPGSVQAQRGWRGLAVRGPLAFELTGVLASLAVPLAQAGVSIFAISTYDTDFVLVRDERLSAAVAALRAAGHDVNERS